jgi:uncharacterized protein YfaS (alpha-2-macroglobulin family)
VGESVLVRVQVKPKVHIGNGLVVDHIPAGLEIENLNIAQGEAMGAVSIAGIDPAAAMADRRIQHVEFRDDRFVAAVRLQGEINLFYRARVVTRASSSSRRCTPKTCTGPTPTGWPKATAA